MKSVKSYDVCYLFMFQEFRNDDWIEKYEKFAMELSSKLDLQYSDFEFTYEMPDGGNEGKTFKYQNSNIKKYKQKKERSQIISLNYLYTPKNEQNRSNPDVYLSCSKARGAFRPYCQFYVHICEDIFSKLGFSCLRESFQDLLNTADSLGKVKYGFMHKLQKEKMPSFYYNGLGNVNAMTEGEYKSNQAWQKYSSEFTSVVRDIYYCNFITSQHIKGKENVWGDIQKIIGTDNFSFLDAESAMFFLIPDEWDKHAQRDDTMGEIEKKVRDILIKNEILKI